jgi:hypothetical protein
MGMEFLVSSITALVEERPLPAPPKPISIPDEDDAIEGNTDPIGYAEGQSFMIEYVDSKGRVSMRRISVYDIVGGTAGIPCLLARCHEKRATRQFRVDRIRCCIDYDGEVHEDVALFLTTTFGMPISVASAKEDDENTNRWRAIVDAIRADAVLLSALSRADGRVKSVETIEAVGHLAALAERQDIFVLEREVASIEAYVKRLRPNADAISRALEALTGSDFNHVRRLLMAAKRVIEADGILHAAEIALINDIARELTGVDLG